MVLYVASVSLAVATPHVTKSNCLLVQVTIECLDRALRRSLKLFINHVGEIGVADIHDLFHLGFERFWPDVSVFVIMLEDFLHIYLILTSHRMSKELSASA
jgi:hypothetical protein